MSIIGNRTQKAISSMLTNPWLPSWTYSSIREKRWWQRTQRRRRGQWWWFRTGFTTQILNCEAVSIFPHQDWHSDWQLRSGGFPITFHQIPAGFTTHFMISLSPTAQYSLRCFQVFHCSATSCPSSHKTCDKGCHLCSLHHPRTWHIPCSTDPIWHSISKTVQCWQK